MQPLLCWWKIHSYKRPQAVSKKFVSNTHIYISVCNEFSTSFFFFQFFHLTAQLKKAVSVAMMEQSRQHVINKRLDETVRCQQKLLLATVQETHQVVQEQAARITRQQAIIQVLFIRLSVHPTLRPFLSFCSPPHPSHGTRHTSSCTWAGN